jgi:glucose 1-dehydrogenase/3-oxoacyl-[acyl-carrier protein] reductase
MFPDFHGSTVVVTGASGGIGSGIAEAFADAGASVLITYRNGKERAEQLVGSIRRRGGDAHASRLDLNDSEQVADFFGQAGGDEWPLMYLINNAGVYPVTPLEGLGEDEWSEVIRTNLDSVYRCTREFASTVERTAERRKGRHTSARQTGARQKREQQTSERQKVEEAKPAVVNIASIEGQIPAPGHAHYGASKAGVIAFTRSAAVEFGPHIRVNSISPGLVGREGIEEEWPEGVERYRNASPLSTIGAAEDIAYACLFLCSPWAKWITGENLVVDGGVGAVMSW